MEMFLIGLIVLMLVANAAILFFMVSRRRGAGDSENAGVGLSLINDRIAELSRTMEERLDRTTQNLSQNMVQTRQDLTQSVQKQMSESFKLIKDVTEGLTKLDETNRQVVSFADQLQNLQNILQNPKQRGILGEYYLETVLKNVMPPGQYQMQYPFKNGEIVDAVVFVKDRVIPIDSKFSLDNYTRFVGAPMNSPERAALEKTFVNDLKLRITETAKYIRPAEGTMDFAFMFIPSEGIYYDLLVNTIGSGEDENLIQRAASKYKVIIVSPTSFLAYLQTVLQGLKALQIEEQAKEIQKRVGELEKHFGAFDEFMKKLGNTLQTTVNHYTSAYKEFAKIDKDVLRIAGKSAGVVPMALSGPERDE